MILGIKRGIRIGKELDGRVGVLFSLKGSHVCIVNWTPAISLCSSWCCSDDHVTPGSIDVLIVH